MKLFIIFSFLPFAFLILASSTVKFTTTSNFPPNRSIAHRQHIRDFSFAIATPYSLPKWGLKNRGHWIPTHNGRPCPNEDGCPQNPYPKPTKAITVNSGAVNINSRNNSASSEYFTQHPSSIAAGDSLVTPLSFCTSPSPIINYHNLLHRQIAIPYIPADWATVTQCPAIFGSPCTTVSQYLPYINDAARRASEEAARASSLIEHGAFVPGMNVPGAASMVELGLLTVVAAFLAAIVAIMVVL